MKSLPSLRAWFVAILLGGLWFAGTATAATHPLGWGNNSAFKAFPVPTNVMSGASAIAAGYDHSLAVKDGRVWAWGTNDFGQTNVPVAAQSGVTKVSAGSSFSMALKSSGDIVVWGSPVLSSNIPANAVSGVSAISAGEWHALVLKNGSVIAWGSNSYGQCNVPVSLTNGVTAIAAGGFYSMALKDGGVQVFGISATNQLAWGIRDIPTEALSGVSAIAAGRWHALALKNGKVIAWGAPHDDATDVPLAAQSDVTAIAAGDLFSYALKTDGSIVHWGAYFDGQDQIPLAAATGVTAIAAGVSHGLALCPVMPPRFLATTLPDAYQNKPYTNQLLVAADPAATFIKGTPWGPSWLNLNVSNGLLTGTPLETGAAQLSVIASNAYGVVTQAFQVTILDKPLEPPVFYTTNPLPSGTVGALYEYQIVFSNTPTISLVSGEGQLPAGLTLEDDGFLHGIPTQVEALFFTVRATNQAGASNRVYNITINAPADEPEFITDSPLPDGVVGQPYLCDIEVANYPNIIGLYSGTFPEGLGITLEGQITGTPVKVETANFILYATNMVGTASKSYSLHISGPPIFVTDSPLPFGSLGEPYSQQIEAIGDPLFLVFSGALPGGLDLATNGWLTGTPTTTGDFNFTVRATNDFGYTNKDYSINIGAGPVFSTTNPLPNGRESSAYSVWIVASGNPDYTLLSGALPGGLTLSLAGELSGIPTTAGTYNFTILASNQYGIADREFDLAILGATPPRITAIRATNGNLVLTWTNYNDVGGVTVWRSHSLTSEPVPWTNLGVQTSPWTNPAPTNTTYFHLRLAP